MCALAQTQMMHTIQRLTIMRQGDSGEEVTSASSANFVPEDASTAQAQEAFKAVAAHVHYLQVLNTLHMQHSLHSQQYAEPTLSRHVQGRAVSVVERQMEETKALIEEEQARNRADRNAERLRGDLPEHTGSYISSHVHDHVVTGASKPRTVEHVQALISHAMTQILPEFKAMVPKPVAPWGGGKKLDWRMPVSWTSLCIQMRLLCYTYVCSIVTGHLRIICV